MWNDFDWLRSSLRPPAGTDTGLEFMGTTFPGRSIRLAAAQDKVRQGILVVASRGDKSVTLRPGQEPEQPALDVERVV